MLSFFEWEKVWVWIKHHWYFPVIGVLLLAFFLKGEGINNKYFDLFLSQREDYKKEIDLINNTREEREKREEQIHENHEKAMELIEEKYRLDSKNLAKNKQEEISELVETHHNDHDKLAEEVAKVLSAEYLKMNKG